MIGAAIVVGVLLYLGRGALTPFIIGALIVYLLDPLVTWVARVKVGRGTVPRGLAVLIVYAVALFVIIAGILMARQERARQRDIQLAKAGDGSVTGAAA